MDKSSPPPYCFTWLAASLVTALAAALAQVGGDARWLAALGAEIVKRGHIPDGVPYAALPSSGWPNVPVLSELAFDGLESALGDRGLVLAQATAAGACLALVALGMRAAGAADLPSALVLFLVALGAAPALVIARVQLFSLVLFPLLVLLVRAEARSPSRRVWLLVPLIALWSSLHGAVLVGLAVAGSYLALHRLRWRPASALLALAATVAAPLATPALERTPCYYLGVLGSEAALRGEGLWAPLSLGKPLDVLFIVVAVPIVASAILSRPAPWELVALLGLAAGAAHTARNGVWLLLFAAAPAARCLTGTRAWRLVPPPPARYAAALTFAAALVIAGLRTPDGGVAGRLLRDAAAKAAGTDPILADPLDAEALALDGRRILIGNPLDAFPRREQRLYLDWASGRASGDVLLARARAVLVSSSERAQERLTLHARFREAGRDAHAVLYVRRSRGRRPPE